MEVRMNLESQACIRGAFAVAAEAMNAEFQRAEEAMTECLRLQALARRHRYRAVEWADLAEEYARKISDIHDD